MNRITESGALFPQLPLAVTLQDGISFDNYFAGPNREAVQTVKSCIQMANERFIYLWGGGSVGKTHLLQSACRVVSEAGRPCAYLTLKQANEFRPEILDGLEELSLVCIDDVNAVAGDKEWEIALFHLYNRAKDNDTLLIVSGDESPGNLLLALPDLSSRLAWGLIFQLHPLNDADKFAALKLRARRRGFRLPDEVGHFLLSRYPRDTAELFSILERLDHASLVAKRRMTIPFVKMVLEQNRVNES